MNEFAACQQGCEEIFPGMQAKKDNIVDNSGGDYPDEYPDDYFEDDISALGKYTAKFLS